MQVIAIMVKRQSVEDGGADRGVVINEVQQLITSNNQQMQMTGCAIITALMQEKRNLGNCFFGRPVFFFLTASYEYISFNAIIYYL